MPSFTALDPLVVVLAVAGGIWGFVADRIAARWPAHEDGSTRRVDWRSVVALVLGAIALAAVPARFADPGTRLVFGLYFAALVLLVATDLDQRLMPDLVTLPLIVLAGIAALAGLDPLMKEWWLAIAGAIVVPFGLLAASLPFGAGAFGLGDVKLLISVGLLGGLLRSLIGVFVGTLAAGLVIAVLLASRRITRRSYVPFGPFLIIGAIWALLLPSASA